MKIYKNNSKKIYLLKITFKLYQDYNQYRIKELIHKKSNLQKICIVKAKLQFLGQT